MRQHLVYLADNSIKITFLPKTAQITMALILQSLCLIIWLLSLIQDLMQHHFSISLNSCASYHQQLRIRCGQFSEHFAAVWGWPSISWNFQCRPLFMEPKNGMQIEIKQQKSRKHWSLLTVIYIRTFEHSYRSWLLFHKLWMWTINQYA